MSAQVAPVAAPTAPPAPPPWLPPRPVLAADDEGAAVAPDELGVDVPLELGEVELVVAELLF